MQLCGKVIRGPASEHHDGTVTMETGMPSFVNVPAPSSSVSEQTENKMHVQAPLTTVFLHTMPGLAPHPQAQAQLPPAASQDPPALHLSIPPLCSKETLPFLTLHIAGGLQLHQQATSLGTAAVLAAKSKSAGKHMCPHCGRDCLKPSVLEKHLRCHTGERPYPCTTCGISFKTQSNLYKHKRTQAHARLSSESEQSSLSSQESLQSSRDTCSSSLSVDALSEDSGSMEKDVSALPALTTTSVSSVLASTVQKVGPDTGWALHQAALVGLILAPVNEQKELSSLVQSTKPSEVRSGPEEIKTDEKEKRAGNKKPPLTPNRHHLPLQRQEATLFSKQWSSMSRGKSQSHDSTDSGFSESSEHHWTSRTSSPGSVLHDHSMESLTESSMELHDQPNPSQTHTGPGLTTPETKSSVSEQEQKKLEERISKLISENDAVVDDKHLENVRPRKTVLSKQGSIDLPMPYTYKDSFHFEMRTNKHSNAAVSWHRPDIGRGRSAMYCSVPTQRSTSLEHAPLTRSSSLPFNVSIQHSERSSIASPHHRDYVTLGRRGSSGQIYPACFVTKSVDQQASHHRPLVRQAAVDCIPTTEGLGMTSSVEEVRLSLDGDSTDISGEPSSRKYRRKKTQKFAYNKWYMYGGGTFKKLYSTEKSTDHSISKAKKSMTNLEHDGIQEIHQRCSAVTSMGSKTDSSATVCHPSCLPANLPPATHVDSNQPSSHLHSSCIPLKNSLLKKQSFSTQPSSIGLINTSNPGSADRTEPVAEKVIYEEKHTDGVSQHCVSHIPSERKKQRTDDTICAQWPRNHQNTSKILTQCFPSVSSDVTNQSDRLQAHSQDINLSFINHHLNPKHIQPKEASSPPCMVNANRKSLKTSSSISTTAKTSFLPKYQLKLPTTAEPDPHPSALTLNQPTGTISYNTTCTVTGTPSQSCQTLSSTMTSGDRDTSASSQQTRMEPFNLPERPHPITITGSAQSQSAIPVTTTTQSQSITTVTRQQSQTALPIPGLVHAESATITTTVASQSTTGSALVKSQHVELTTALVQTTPPNPVIASAQSQSSTPIIVSVQNLTEPIAASVQNQPGARSTVSTQNQYPAIIQAAAPSEHINPLNSMTAEVNPATIPCQIIPFNDSPQLAAHNVFHVRTADLQICLQIISDEQLALMEPQIERQGLTLGAGLSQRNLHGSTENAETMINSEGTAREVSQQSYCLLPVSEAQESSKKDMEREMTEPQKQTDPRETENVKNIHFPSQPECFHQTQENTTVPMHGSLDKSEKSDILESTLPTCTGQLSQRFVSSKLPGPLFHPQTHTNMLTQKKAFGVMSALGSLKGVKSDRNQTGEGEKDVLPLCFLSEEHLLPKSTISQKGLISEMISGQYKLCLAAIAPPSPTSAAESSSGNRLLVSQHKPLNQRAKYNVGRLKTKHGTPVHEAPTSEGLTSGQRSHAESSVSFHSKDFLFPINHVYENPGEPKPQETQFSQMTSVPCCFLEERPKDVPGVSAAIQSVTAAGVKEGGPLTGCALQRESESQTLGHARIPREPESRDAEPRERQGPGQMDNQPLERQEGRGAGEREVDSRGKRSQKGDVPEQREGKVGTAGVFAHLSDVLREDNDEAKDEADSKQKSWLAVQPHQQFSQTAGMFYNPLQTFKHESGSSSIPHPPGGSDTSIFNTSLPLNEIKTKSVLISQLPINSETSILHTHRAPNFGETYTKQSHQTQDQCETNIPATTQSLPQRQTIDQMSHPDDINATSMEMPKDPQAACHAGNDTTMHPPDPSTSLHLESSFQPQRVNLTALSPTTHNNIPLRPEGLSKDNSVSSDDQILSYPTPDCLTISSVRAVQSSLEDLDDTSSSDDEGKLIIEL